MMPALLPWQEITAIFESSTQLAQYKDGLNWHSTKTSKRSRCGICLSNFGGHMMRCKLPSEKDAHGVNVLTLVSLLKWLLFTRHLIMWLQCHLQPAQVCLVHVQDLVKGARPARIRNEFINQGQVVHLRTLQNVTYHFRTYTLGESDLVADLAKLTRDFPIEKANANDTPFCFSNSYGIVTAVQETRKILLSPHMFWVLPQEASCVESVIHPEISSCWLLWSCLIKFWSCFRSCEV